MKIKIFLIISILACASTALALIPPNVTVTRGVSATAQAWAMANYETERHLLSNFVSSSSINPLVIQVEKGATVVAGKTALTVGATGVASRAVGMVSRLNPYVGMAMTGVMLYETMRETVLEDATSKARYPAVAPVLFGTVPYGTLTQNSAINDIVTIASLGQKKVTTRNQTYGADYCMSGTSNSDGDVYVQDANYTIFLHADMPHTGCTAPNANFDLWKISFIPDSTPAPTRLKTDAEVIDELNGTYGGATAFDGSLDAAYMADLKKLYEDAQYQGDPATLKTLEGELIQKAANDAKADADAATTAAATDATTKAADLRSKATAARIYANANPTDKVAEAAAAAAEAAAAAAESVAATLAAQDKAKAADELNAIPADQVLPTYDATITLPDKEPIPTLLETIWSSAPVTGLATAFSFDATGSCSEEMFTAYGETFYFDMCPYTTQVQLAGTIILFFAHLSALFIIFSKKAAGGD